ncbi:S1 family peptidase [Pedobacter mucosus]|uniref:S1 family peptidase n=1 Tax=Pedobacter mucosus TaxID=2895286 RepID=UPI001EE4E273|nr:serine protease [Pedobacter mucosus]UKT64290.1 serine protease [Pedobacter mucosus]
MSVSLFEFVDHNAIKITVTLSDGTNEFGSGFFFQYTFLENKSATVIVTNIHVVERAVSASFRITTTDDQNKPDHNDIKDITITDIQNWVIPHPEKNIDLCIIPIAKIFSELEKLGKEPYFAPLREHNIPDYNDTEIYKPTEDIYMAGFPNGLADDLHNLPLVRRGITATPFFIKHNGSPEFIIDCACFTGSSGSPIMIVNESSYALHKQPLQQGNRLKLLGILYAGPLYDAQGIVYKKNVPTINTTITNIPMNLGYCIQSDKILDFKPIIESRM